MPPHFASSANHRTQASLIQVGQTAVAWPNSGDIWGRYKFCCGPDAHGSDSAGVFSAGTFAYTDRITSWHKRKKLMLRHYSCIVPSR